ncbi:MAG: 4-hydroxy-3-methylbut-2-enyl diphosphate reductase [candidate division WOR-3 bacterium]|nr:4-hydroxy-3-methylbut-2-enyl diphosphate reductase [candidate division WOR-3 bacterium]
MAKIHLIKPYGFCSGLKRALYLIENCEKRYSQIFLLGELLHNPMVIKDLKEKGIKIIKEKEIDFLNNLKEEKDKTVVVIRTHGVSKEILKKIQNFGINIINTICGYIKKSCLIAENLKKEGYWVVIVGDWGHPEVKTIKSFAEEKGIIYKKNLNLKNNQKIGVISQTTLDETTYKEAIINIINNFQPKELRIFNTLCPEVIERQKKVKEIAKKVDLMVIVGGKNSANTKRLKEIAEREGCESFWVTSLKELPSLKTLSKKFAKIGIASGTSTPESFVDLVVKNLKKGGN